MQASTSVLQSDYFVYGQALLVWIDSLSVEIEVNLHRGVVPQAIPKTNKEMFGFFLYKYNLKIMFKMSIPKFVVFKVKVHFRFFFIIFQAFGQCQNTESNDISLEVLCHYTESLIKNDRCYKPQDLQPKHRNKSLIVKKKGGWGARLLDFYGDHRANYYEIKIWSRLSL